MLNKFRLYKDKKLDKNSMLYWYPKVKDLVPTPKTKFIKLKNKKGYNGTPKTWDVNEIKEVTKELGGFPVFVRTDQASNKHLMERASKITEASEINDHIMEIIFFNETVCGGLGLPYECLAIREWLELDHKFEAFVGTPIAQELRFFIRDGEVECFHFYWPKESIAEDFREESNDDICFILEEPIEEVDNDINPIDEKIVDNWEGKWEITRQTSLEGVEKVYPLAQKVANVMEGYWSVDFAKAKDGTWYLIDMALGEESWHPKEECKTE